jgi:diguanylate cyclase (GGDEF)-like protein
LVEKLSIVSKRRNALRLFSVALILSVLMVWGIEQIVVARSFKSFQENLNRNATRLADGKNKSVVLGSMIMMGSINHIIRDTAQGALKPSNPEVMALLTRLEVAYGLSNIRVINQEGEVVAYYTKSSKSAVGKNRSIRPYFTAAMKGEASMYAALGHTSGERGFYIAAPILEKDAAIDVSSLGFEGKPTSRVAKAAPNVIGAVVAKLGFEEVDRLLQQDKSALAVVSPEGVVFASNVAAWQYQVLGRQQNIDLLKNEQRVNAAFEMNPPHLMAVDDRGWLWEKGHSLKMVSSTIDWKDPQGSWRLVGFADTHNFFGNIARILVGVLCFAFILLCNDWWLARQRVAERTADLEEANRHLAALSHTDGLTRLSNRRHFDKVLTEEWLRAKRNGQPLTLMLIDVDHFKKFNDHYGHQAGDRCLQSIASSLQSSAQRAGDMAARYGGEEFCLLLADTNAEIGQQLAEAVRHSIELLCIPHALSPSGIVTVSIGVAVMVPEAGHDAESLLHFADKALYCAKNDGRNRVVLAK